MSWFAPLLYHEGLYAAAVGVASRYGLNPRGIRCLFWEGNASEYEWGSNPVYWDGAKWHMATRQTPTTYRYFSGHLIDFPLIPRAYGYPFAWMVFSSSDESLYQIGVRRKMYPLCHVDPGQDEGVFDVIAGARTNREKARAR